MAEPLPRGAQFKRAKTLWEIALGVAGDPDIPYDGPRDICISIGSGSGAQFKARFSMSVGSPELAYAVAKGEIDFGFVNPSGALTQAYLGKGMFKEPLPLRVVFSYPSWDRFLCMIHPRTGLTSLADIKDKRYPLRASIREDKTHSTLVLINQLFGMYGFSLDDLVSWGGSLQLNGPPMDPRRMAALREGTVDAVFDEGIGTWCGQALEAGFQLVAIDEPVLRQVTDLGWRQAILPKGWRPGVNEDHVCIDYSGWPVYTRASMPDNDVYQVLDALAARAGEVPWEDTFESVPKLGSDAEATPLDVPLHPAAERWYREHA